MWNICINTHIIFKKPWKQKIVNQTKPLSKRFSSSLNVRSNIKMLWTKFLLRSGFIVRLKQTGAVHPTLLLCASQSLTFQHFTNDNLNLNVNWSSLHLIVVLSPSHRHLILSHYLYPALHQHTISSSSRNHRRLKVRFLSISFFFFPINFEFRSLESDFLWFVFFH